MAKKKHTPGAEPEGIEGEMIEAADAELISVRSAHPTRPDGGSVVVLWEKHPAHPNGEAFISGDAVVLVGLTPTVSKLLRDGAIEEVTEAFE